MKTGPKITIVTPTYNSEQYVARCVESVLSQTYPNVEYVVMDGGSTDGTLAALSRYAGRLTVVSERDKGNYDAIRKGFECATGDVLTWVDSDNYYASKDILAKVAEAFEEGASRGVEVVIADAYSKREGDERLSPFTPPEAVTRELLLHRGNKLMPEATFFKRKLYERLGGLDLSFRMLADYDLWIRLLSAARAVARLHERAAVYEARSSALLRKNFLLAWRESFAVGKKHGRPLIWRAYFAWRFLVALAWRWTPAPLKAFIRK